MRALFVFTEQKLLFCVFPFYQVETNKSGKQCNDLMARDCGKTHNLVQRQLLALHDFKQFSDVVCVGHHGALWVLRFAPNSQMYWRGNDVLVGNTDVGARFFSFRDYADGALVGWWDGSDNNGATFNMVGIELNTGLGATITVCSLVHHVDLFFGTYTRHVAVVANADEQSPTVSISKCRYRFGQLQRIRNPILEVLLLVLAFLYEALKILFVVRG